MIRPLSIVDAGWLLLESRNMPMHVGMLMEFTPPADAPPDYLRRVREEIAARAHFPPPWNMIPVRAPFVGSLPILQEVKDVDVDYHVRQWGLPAPGGQRELGVLVSRLQSQQLDIRRPLWELHIIEGLPGGRFALFVKVHHSLVDGVSAMRFLAQSMSEDPNDRSATVLFSSAPQVKKPKNGASEKKSRNPLKEISKLALAGPELAYKLTAASAQLTFGRGPVPFLQPSTVLGGHITGQRRFATQQYDFAAIRALAEAGGVTVNDIVLYLCGTALRKYLAEYATLPPRSLVAAIPVNLREEGDLRAGTHVGMVYAELATNVANPRERLRAIHESMNAAKKTLKGLPDEAVLGYGTVVNLPWVTGLLAGLAERSPVPQSLVVSNVPGPRKRLYWNGARLDAMYPMSMVLHGNALNVTCISYAGTLNVGFTGARDSVPHLQRLATSMGEALRELQGILLPAPPPAPSPNGNGSIVPT